MGIRVNLLPDVRLAKLRDQRMRQLALGVSILVWSLSGLVVVGLFIGYSAQNYVLTDLNKGIAADLTSINSISDLSTALTAQQATKALGTLYDQNIKYSNFIPNLASRTPKDISLSSVTADPMGMLTVAGIGKNAYAIDTFVNALQSPAPGKTTPLFSNVVLGTLTKDPSGKATFSLTASINPEALNGQN